MRLQIAIIASGVLSRRRRARGLIASWMAASLVLASATPSPAQTFPSSTGNNILETVAKGLDHPWALAFLPDGRLLVTERPGRMRIVANEGKISPAIAGVPKVFASGQGGLHDVILDRDYADNHTIDFCYAEPAGGGGRTALARARLLDEGMSRLDDVAVILHQEGPLSSGNHFGCRIVQTPDNNLFLTLGDHFTTRNQAQNLANHLGKIVRIRPDGSVPPDNPFVGKQGAKPEIWSFGHRNPQGLALHPVTGKLWEHEHGPRGGDEVNIIEKGKNYGWPVIGYGIDYNGAKIHESTHKEGMEQPIWYWVPSVAPSGMAFYSSKPVSKLAWQFVRRRTCRADACAARARRGKGAQGRATVAAAARAHPRCPPGSGRRAVARHRQQRWPHPALETGVITQKP